MVKSDFFFKSTHGGETKKRRWAELVKFLYMPEMGLLGRPGRRNLVEYVNRTFPQLFFKNFIRHKNIYGIRLF